ncbi:hypothetical protein ASZ78_011241 [Callipepla squamata]|uniref:Uncharacterized protein n=1 Tax=Callipepla squamata TaxID=9009 RepID=A0A226N560_CALSU|nr:hypothetical protein ASZ78_011241 [Callipepla squamata]
MACRLLELGTGFQPSVGRLKEVIFPLQAWLLVMYRKSNWKCGYNLAVLGHGNNEKSVPQLLISDLKFEKKSLAKLMFSPDQENHPSKAPVKYGELIVLGRFIIHWFYNSSFFSPQAISNKDQHSISYTLSRAQTVVVEYTHDSNTDMFQEKAAKWKTSDGQMDGLTTNGVLVMHPRNGFTEDSKPGVWREISVCGNVFSLRETRSAQQRGKMVENETNQLQDGSLIDLCGATLLWRTAEGLSRTPTVKHLEALRQEINAARPQCPVGFNTLAFPSMKRKDVVDEKQPWVYLNCGHVHGYHNWGNKEERDGKDRECPMCRSVGPYVPLWLGCEAGFYVDAGPPTHAFSPCGHVENETNQLQDGSLIDLCGATLLWRTAEGLSRTPTVKHLEALRQEINAARPQCPVGFNTLAFPSMKRKDVVDEKQPWVYLNCGHVHGYHNWGNKEERDGKDRECPMCRSVGPYVPLWLGCEAGFYVDAGPPTHAFSPCGHVCSEKTTAYWSQIPLPHGTHTFHAACPFCAHQLAGEQGYIRLIFQGPLD